MSQDSLELVKLYERLGGLYPLHSEKYFKIALTHPSMDGKPGANYEQLEFLGDSVLSLVVSDFLYQNFPLKKEGDLTKMRSHIVSRPQLNALAEELQLDQFIQHKIEKKYINLAKDIGGNVIEAIIGAYYLDGGIEAAKKFVQLWVLRPEMTENLHIKNLDPKSVLHEWAQRRKKKLDFRQLNPNIQNPSNFIVEVWIDDKKYGVGQGVNKKTAEKNAAQHTLILLDPHAR